MLQDFVRKGEVVMETIEESVFARRRWVPEKMRAFGFRPVGDGYVLELSLIHI